MELYRYKKISLSECLPQKIEAVLFGFLCLTNNLTLYTKIIGLIGNVHERCYPGCCLWSAGLLNVVNYFSFLGFIEWGSGSIWDKVVLLGLLSL